MDQTRRRRGWPGAGFRWKCLVGIFALGSAALLRADEIWLNDGSVREGIIVEEGRGHLVIEVMRDGVARAERVARDQVARVVWGAVVAADSTQGSAAEELVRRARIAQLTGTGRAHYDFGIWCAGKNHHLEAVKAYETAAKTDAALAPDALYRAALSLVELEQIDRAKRVLTELVRKDPKHHKAAIELGRLDADNASRLATLASLAVDRFKKGEHAGSISTLVRLADLKDPAQVVEVEQRLRSMTGLSIADLIVENRFRAGCPTCGKALRPGLVNCPQCKGTGSAAQGRNRIADAPEGDAGRNGSRAESTGQVCRSCRGYTYIICPRCGGAGHDFGVIGQTEREAMRSRLEREIDAQWDGDLRLFVTGERELITPLVEDILLRAKKLQYFLGVLESQLDRETPDRLEAVRERRKLVDAFVAYADAAYANRTLAALTGADRIQLEKLLLEDDTLAREIAGQTAGEPRLEAPEVPPAASRATETAPAADPTERP